MQKIYTLLLILSFTVCYVKPDLGLKEGDSCMTDGVNGTCLNIYKCPLAAINYIYRNAGFTKTLPDLPNFCSMSGPEPVVCCSGCLIEENQRFKYLSVGVYGIEKWKKGPVAWNKCYENFEKLPYPCRGEGNIKLTKRWNYVKKCDDFDWGVALAVGGRDAERWEFPHMALLGYGEGADSAEWLCGGTVISERFILTAAHCSSAPFIGQIKYAALGLLKRTDPKELWKIYNIKRIITHPEYKSPSKYHDIALLETEKEITFGKDLLPACLDVGKRSYNKSAEAAGWGRLGHKQELADVLQVVTLEEFEEKECSKIYAPHRHLKSGYNHTTQRCYGAHGKIVDTCEGDSGGPLQDSEFKCLYLVVGVTSYGKSCGIADTAGMYTRVQFYVPWIESIVWPEKHV